VDVNWLRDWLIERDHTKRLYIWERCVVRAYAIAHAHARSLERGSDDDFRRTFAILTEAMRQMPGYALSVDVAETVATAALENLERATRDR